MDQLVWSPMGIDCAMYRETVSTHEVVLQIWDTAGQNRFHSIAYHYMRGASVVMLVYDISDRTTFESVCDSWEYKTRLNSHKRALFVLVGNKSDSSTREVSRQDASAYASSVGFMFFECSAKTGHSVDQMFMQTAERVLSNHGSMYILKDMGSGTNTQQTPLLKGKEHSRCLSCMIA